MLLRVKMKCIKGGSEVRKNREDRYVKESLGEKFLWISVETR